MVSTTTPIQRSNRSLELTIFYRFSNVNKTQVSTDNFNWWNINDNTSIIELNDDNIAYNLTDDIFSYDHLQYHSNLIEVMFADVTSMLGSGIISSDYPFNVTSFIINKSSKKLVLVLNEDFSTYNYELDVNEVLRTDIMFNFNNPIPQIDSRKCWIGDNQTFNDYQPASSICEIPEFLYRGIPMEYDTNKIEYGCAIDLSVFKPEQYNDWDIIKDGAYEYLVLTDTMLETVEYHYLINGKWRSVHNLDNPMTDHRLVEDIGIMHNGSLYTFGFSYKNVYTGKLTKMNHMFSGMYKFNADIGYWDIRNVREMISMFRDAYEFDQDLSCWDCRNVLACTWIYYGLNDWAMDKRPKNLHCSSGY